MLLSNYTSKSYTKLNEIPTQQTQRKTVDKFTYMKKVSIKSLYLVMK